MDDLKAFKEYESYGEAKNNISNVLKILDYIYTNSTGGSSMLDGNFTLLGTNSTNLSSTEVQNPGRNEFLAKIEQFVLGLIFVLTILGNLLVIVGIYCRKQKMTRMYYFILHLSFADLTTAFFNVLTQLFWEITYRFRGGSFMCKFVKYTQILGPYSSSYILVMTALDRYQAICYPLSNCSWTARRSKLMLGGAWILSFLFCLPQLHIFSYQEVTPEVFDCWATFVPNWGEKAYITWYCITVFIVPLLILIFAYSCITRAIWLNFSMKNKAMKLERPTRNFNLASRDDTNDLDNSSDENESPVLNEKGKLCEKSLTSKLSVNSSSKEKSFAVKNLEVSWHQKNQETKTTAALNNASKPLGRFHSAPVETGDGWRKDLSPESQYGDGVKINVSVAQSFRIKSQSTSQKHCIFSPASPETHTYSVNGAVHSPDNSPEEHDTIRSPEIDSRRRKWKSLSSKPSKHSIEDGSNSKDIAGMGLYRGSKNNGSRKYSASSRRKGTKSPSDTPNKSKPTSLAESAQPRTHSVKGISRAKIKTIKLTVTVICCYIICSTPFIAALLWSAYDPYAKEHPFFFGPTFTILTLLASLNSCANSWIVLFFNPNLLSFVRNPCGKNQPQRPNAGGPQSTISISQKKFFSSPKNNPTVGTNSNQISTTSVIGLSPIIRRLSRKETNRSNRNDRETIELIPPMDTTSKSTSPSQQQQPNSLLNQNQRGKNDSIPIETSFIGI